jgi:hypothetical protein
MMTEMTKSEKKMTGGTITTETICTRSSFLKKSAWENGLERHAPYSFGSS